MYKMLNSFPMMPSFAEKIFTSLINTAARRWTVCN